MITETYKKIYIQNPIKGKVEVGVLKKERSGILFRKNVVRSKHYMRIVEGYGLQKEVFDKYLRGKKGRIAIKELDTGKFLIASIGTWTNHSKSGNYGDGKQIFLAEKYMHGSDNFDRSDISEGPVINIEVRLELGQMYKKILAQKGLA